MWQSQYNRPIIWGCLKSHKNGTWGLSVGPTSGLFGVSQVPIGTRPWGPPLPTFETRRSAKLRHPETARGLQKQGIPTPYLRISWGFSNPKWGYNREMSNRISLYKKGLCFFFTICGQSQMLVLQSLSATAKGLVARQHVVQALMVETPKKYW